MDRAADMCVGEVVLNDVNEPHDACNFRIRIRPHAGYRALRPWPVLEVNDLEPRVSSPDSVFASEPVVRGIFRPFFAVVQCGPPRSRTADSRKASRKLNT